MSEPCSFFLRASIDKAQYLAFMQAKPSQLVVNDNWQKWWDSRQMHGKSTLAETLSESLGAWGFASNQDFVNNAWLAEEYAMAFSEFDEATSTWEFGVLDCSENYETILPLLVFCHSLFASKFFSPDDFAIVYSYFWPDNEDVMAYATFERDGFVLTSATSHEDVAKKHLDHAESRLEKKWKEFEPNQD